MRFHLLTSEKTIIFALFFREHGTLQQNRPQKYKEILKYAIFLTKVSIFWLFFRKKDN